MIITYETIDNSSNMIKNILQKGKSNVPNFPFTKNSNYYIKCSIYLCVKYSFSFYFPYFAVSRSLLSNRIKKNKNK